MLGDTHIARPIGRATSHSTSDRPPETRPSRCSSACKGASGMKITRLLQASAVVGVAALALAGCASGSASGESGSTAEAREPKTLRSSPSTRPKTHPSFIALDGVRREPLRGDRRPLEDRGLPRTPSSAPSRVASSSCSDGVDRPGDRLGHRSSRTSNDDFVVLQPPHGLRLDRAPDDASSHDDEIVGDVYSSLEESDSLTVARRLHPGRPQHLPQATDRPRRRPTSPARRSASRRARCSISP